jgi:hypothetical protein
VVSLVREHGLMDAKAMIASDATVRALPVELPPPACAASGLPWACLADRGCRLVSLHPPIPTDPNHQIIKERAPAVQAQIEAEAAARAAEAAALLSDVPAELADVLDALKRSPLMLELPATHPGLAAIAHMVRAWAACSCMLLHADACRRMRAL